MGACENVKVLLNDGLEKEGIALFEELGIVVKSAPYGNTNAVAELTIGMMLSIARYIPHAHKSLKNGTWKKEQLKGTELAYKTLGILGCGKIGQRVGELARRGFDMEVIGYDICPCLESAIQYMSKEDVLAKADYVSIHTGGKDIIVGEKELSLMKPTAYLINTSRGCNVDEQALYKALKEGKIAGAAIDVYTREPKVEGAEFKSKMRELDNVIFSSHLGASTIEAQRETSAEIARVVARYLFGGDFTSAVNADESIELEERHVYALFSDHG